DLRAAMFRRLLALPARYFDAHSTGGLVSRFTYDVAQLRLACTEAVTAAVRDSLYVAGLLVWMLYVDWRMTLAVLLVAPVITLVVVRIRHRLRTMNRKVQEAMAGIHHALNEVIAGHRIIRIFGGEAQEAARFDGIIGAN